MGPFFYGYNSVNRTIAQAAALHRRSQYVAQSALPRRICSVRGCCNTVRCDRPLKDSQPVSASLGWNRNVHILNRGQPPSTHYRLEDKQRYLAAQHIAADGSTDRRRERWDSPQSNDGSVLICNNREHNVKKHEPGEYQNQENEAR